MVLNPSGNVIGATLPTPTNIPMLAANNAEITITATLNGYASQGLLQQYNQQQAAAQAAVWAQLLNGLHDNVDTAGALIAAVGDGAELVARNSASVGAVIIKNVGARVGGAAVALGVALDVRAGDWSMAGADAGVGAVVVSTPPPIDFGVAAWWAGVKNYPGGPGAYWNAFGDQCSDTGLCGP